MNYKIISMDFDGTLLTSDKQVTEETRETLIELKEKDYIIIGITARILPSVKNVCDIGMFDYLILNNGNSLYDVKNKIGIEMGGLEEKSIIKITNYFKDISEEIDYYSLDKCYIYKKMILQTKNYKINISDITEIKEKIARINVFFKTNEEIIKYKDFINCNFDDIDAFEMLYTDNTKGKRWLSINPKNVNKFKTLEKLCLDLNVNMEEVIFFGDGTNDLPLIGKAGLGVAMGNALNEVKEQAKETTLSNDENGIAYFLKKRIL